MIRPFVSAALLSVAVGTLAIFGTPARSGADEVVYVLDVSRSHGPGPELLAERVRLRHEARPDAGAPYRVVFAGAAAVEAGPVAPDFAEGSRVELGLALARRLRGSARTVAVLTDGRFDHAPVREEARAIAAEGARVTFEGPLAEPAADVRLVPRGPARVEGMRARVTVGVAGTHREPRSVRLAAASPAGTVEGEMLLEPGVLAEWEALVPVGAVDRTVSVRLTPGDGPDAAPANDLLDVPLEREALRALLVADRDGSQGAVIAAAVVMAGFELERVVRLADVDAERLAAADLVVLVDRPALGVPPGVVAAIERAVAEGGRGLLVVGGRHAFGAGGYAGSRLDDLLPLSSRLTRPRQVTVLLDASGSMETAERLPRAAEAVSNLAQGLGPEDRIQVVPFADAARPPIPAEPAPPSRFLASALPDLRRLTARGGTRLAPALDAAIARPPPEAREDVLVVVTDARDDQVTEKDLATRRRALADRGANVVVVLLDPTDETRGRARAIATHGVIVVSELEPRILLDVVEGEAFVARPVPTRLPGGEAGPECAFRNRVRAGEGALVALTTVEGEPLFATAFRGAGRTAAWAAWPSRDGDAAAMAVDWARKTSRPAEWKRVSARRESGGLVVRMPADLVPRGQLAAATLGARRPLAERTPGVFDAPADAGSGGHLVLLEGDRTFAVVPLPPAGDPEYAWPAVLPPDVGGAPEGGGAARLRWPWALVSAAAWVAAAALRRRSQAGLMPERRAGR